MVPPSKRKHVEEGQATDLHSTEELVDIAITDPSSAEVAIRHILAKKYLSPRLLKEMTKGYIAASFSNVTYAQIAPFVGLDPDQQMRDIDTFELSRFRIPTSLFKSIVEDMDILLPQYGPILMHTSEEETSRYLAPIYNRLVSVFGFAFQNKPESIIEGRITTRGRVEYFFKSFGSVAFLVVEFKTKFSGYKDRLDAVAQVIAETDSCDFNNREKGLAVVVYGILCDGSVFQFFQFDGATKPYSFRRGTLAGDPQRVRHGFKLPDFSTSDTPEIFLRALRPICEIIFGLFLNSYIACLGAYHSRSLLRAKNERRARKSTGEWERALSNAQLASKKFQEAEQKRQEQQINVANSLVEKAMESLKLSIGDAPNIHPTNFVMNSWKQDEVERF